MVISKKATLQSICRETLIHTSAHGVSSILRSRSNHQKNCWIIFVVVVVGCMLWQCSELINTFFHYPSQEKVTLVNSARLKFPAVTFCNLNQVRKSLMLSKFSFLKGGLYFLNTDYANSSQNQKAYIEDSNQLGFLLSKLNPDQQAEAGHQLEDMLISCHFHGEKCDKSFFNAFFNHKFGNCYTFNSLTKMENRGRLMRRDVLNATKAGFSYGLTMELSIEQDEYIEQFSQAAGIRLIIHDQKDMPFPEDDGVNIPPGQESDIAIVKVHVHRLRAPYSSTCTTGDGIHNYYRDVYKVGYSREACKKTCGQMYIIKNCGCGMWEFPVPKDVKVPFCNITNKNINKCVQLYEDKFAHDELECNCPLQCEEEIFELTLSSSQWPSAVYMNEFARKLRQSGGKLAKVADKVRDNLVKVIINYQQLNYELIEEIPSFQVIDLVSSIGGLVGLWIGVSICTVAEFVELFLKVIIFIIKRVIRKNKEAPLNPYMIAHQTFKSSV
ncbi:amiloride-sensitive sodium channel subunit gamma-like [Lepisosteus oculatus]|uniref:amiloride-sensitive sodium channel subunit gamma-like n=1 Tax=Lepisosteus oculatus TaxID=7918 RepID=UPI0003EAE311|nr:PREDICTED: amiloride-sensitive sodium channel subunit gamma-like [Lepisosteus oculatus]